MTYTASADSEYKVFLPPRDFVGYGLEKPKGDVWPKGAKIAVSFVLNYEEGAEHTVWNGDEHSEPFLNEANYYRNRAEGKRDMYTESLYDYGIRAGLPRIIRLFQSFSYPFTLWLNSRAIETSAQYGPILVGMGCDMAAHGNRWITQTELSGPEEEAAHVRQGIERIQKASGKQDVPSGWYLGRGSLYSKHVISKVHKEMGVPLLYCSDSYADDLPYWVEDPLSLDGEEDKGMLMVPYGLVNNDHKFYSKGAGASTAVDWFNILKGDFETLYSEGQDGEPKMMTIALHSRLIGRPGRLAGLKKFLEYITAKDDVWVTTRADIAKHWREKFPYETVGAQRLVHGDA